MNTVRPGAKLLLELVRSPTRVVVFLLAYELELTQPPLLELTSSTGARELFHVAGDSFNIVAAHANVSAVRAGVGFSGPERRALRALGGLLLLLAWLLLGLLAAIVQLLHAVFKNVVPVIAEPQVVAGVAVVD